MSYYAAATSTNVLNELFDQQASLRLQLETMGLKSLKDLMAKLNVVADEVKEKFGRRPGPTTLWRLLTGQAVRPIYGLRETEIAWTFFTSSHIAEDAQRAELDLRVTKFSDGNMHEALARAAHTAKQLRDRLARQSSHRRDLDDESESNLDQAAVASLYQQISLHRAALPEAAKNEEMANRLMAEAEKYGLQVLHFLRGPLVAGAGERADLIVGARGAVNTLFAVFTLDRLSGCSMEELTRTGSFVRRHGTPSLFRAAFACAAATRDPRLAHYFAEFAILLPHQRLIYSEGIDLKAGAPSSNPLITSARLLSMSKKLDGEEETPINDWHPRWREGRIPQIDEAQELVAQAERTSLALN
jgi:hypothetical protein